MFRSLGFQAYSIRKALARDTTGSLAAMSNAGFVELAGPAESTYAQIAKSIADYAKFRGTRPPIPPILGAHVCPIQVGQDPKDVQDLIRIHVDAFPTLEWLVFTLNPADIDTIEQSEPSRIRIYTQYGYRLLNYFEWIRKTWPSRTLNVAYHAYPHDFLSTGSRVPAIKFLADRIRGRINNRWLQLDVYFASMAGISVIDIISALGMEVHSIHINSWNADGSQCSLRDGIISTTAWRAFTAECKRFGIDRAIVEHDSETASFGHVLASISYLVENGLAVAPNQQ